MSSSHSNKHNNIENLFHASLISVYAYTFIFWSVPILCVQSWIEKFNEDSRKEEEIDVFFHYQSLSKVFSNFLLWFYSILQFISIVITFSSLAKFVNPVTSIDLTEYLMFAGFMIALGEKGTNMT